MHMSVPMSENRPPTFEIKSAQLPLVALMLKTHDWQQLTIDLLTQFGPKGESADFFDQDALVIDFSQLDTNTPLQDMVPLLQALKSCRLVPVAVRGTNPQWLAMAHTLGLVEAEAEIQRPKPVIEVIIPEEPIADPATVLSYPGTMIVNKPLRSGQKVYARGGDLVVLAMVNQGAEVVADGSIHVYAPLRGKAIAGAQGDTSARIFSLCLEPELVSIAGVYRTGENPLSTDVNGKPAQVRLSNDGQDKLLFEPLNS
jgi:septum site-determining protein MinC